MKNYLMAGTALAAATMFVAGGALAADKKMMKPSITVNGYYESVIGAVLDESQDRTRVTDDDLTSDTNDLTTSKSDVAKDTSALDTRTDAEIYFNGRATLDSGMKIHAHVQLEGQYNHSASDPIDEHFVSVSGSFGQIILGGTGGAPVRMLTGLSGSWATGVGETLNFDDAWVPSAGGNHYGLQHSRLDTGDAEKITYISPKLGGFQVGLTYSPNRVNNDDNSRVNTEAMGAYDGLEGAVNYTGKFGDVGFGVGAGMTSYQGCDGPKMKDGKAYCDDTGVSDWLVAARIDFGGGFRVAIAHKQVTNDKKAMESTLTDAGVRFVQGANSFSLVGSMGEMKNSDAQHTAVMGSYARALGPGVKWHANILWNSSEGDPKASNNAVAPTPAGVNADGTLRDATTGTAADESYMDTQKNSGVALITGIKVVF